MTNPESTARSEPQTYWPGPHCFGCELFRVSEDELHEAVAMKRVAKGVCAGSLMASLAQRNLVEPAGPHLQMVVDGVRTNELQYAIDTCPGAISHSRVEGVVVESPAFNDIIVREDDPELRLPSSMGSYVINQCQDHSVSEDGRFLYISSSRAHFVVNGVEDFDPDDLPTYFAVENTDVLHDAQITADIVKAGLYNAHARTYPHGYSQD